MSRELWSSPSRKHSHGHTLAPTALLSCDNHWPVLDLAPVNCKHLRQSFFQTHRQLVRRPLGVVAAGKSTHSCHQELGRPLRRSCFKHDHRTCGVQLQAYSPEENKGGLLTQQVGQEGGKLRQIWIIHRR